MTYTTYPAAVELIADMIQTNVRMHADLGGKTVTPVEALDTTIQYFYDRKHDARHRLGIFRYGLTTEEKYETDFLAMVAYDAELNTHRPSVGYVRDAILDRVKA